MTKRASARLLAPLLALALLAGCGSSASKPSGTSTATGSSSAGGAATVKTASSGVGTILVDGTGKTIYLFQKDTGPRSTCSGACLQQWPAVTTHGKPQAGSGATASMLGTSTRGDGTVQVTYAGHPLYFFASDSAAGDMNGQGVDAFGAKWYVLGPNGKQITSQASTGSGGGGSSGY
jgi:predicted lipoprotein with Yx(FWY)xxD motif